MLVGTICRRGFRVYGSCRAFRPLDFAGREQSRGHEAYASDADQNHRSNDDSDAQVRLDRKERPRGRNDARNAEVVHEVGEYSASNLGIEL